MKTSLHETPSLGFEKQITMIPYATFGPAAFVPSSSTNIATRSAFPTVLVPTETCSLAALPSRNRRWTFSAWSFIRSHSFPSTAAHSRSCSNSAEGSTAGGAATCHQCNTSGRRSHMQSASYINEIQRLCPVKSIVLITTSLSQTPSLGFEKQKTIIPYATCGPAAFVPSSSTNIATRSAFPTVLVPTETCSLAALPSRNRRWTFSAWSFIRSHSFPSTAARSRSCSNSAAGSTAGGAATCHQ